MIENVVLDKSKSFAAGVIKAYKYICEKKKEFPISHS